MIKNSNEIIARNNFMVRGAFTLIKNIHRVSQFVDTVDSFVGALSLMALGQAFVRIRKVERA